MDVLYIYLSNRTFYVQFDPLIHSNVWKDGSFEVSKRSRDFIMAMMLCVLYCLLCFLCFVREYSQVKLNQLFLFDTLICFMFVMFVFFLSDSTRCGVWILGGEDDYQDLLRYALTSESLENAFILIVVDMSQPWNIIDSLEKYTRVLRRHIDSLRIPPEKLRDLEQRRKC